ncbi:hypothetical protein [Octadecabacter ascidiaceicola]|uniref:hypothetical protein n=1 Tax=Octadecabacter ascidiaceicola TaxID=1655543 RepID=UPI00117F9B62|nr:hypothetical protein [Octadecabacter ascidiaceicola]
MSEARNNFRLLIANLACMFLATFGMFLGSRIFEWDVSAGMNFVDGLQLYVVFGFCIGIPLAIVTIGVWLLLRRLEINLVWWLPPLLLATFGGFVLKDQITHVFYGIGLGVTTGLAFWLLAVGPRKTSMIKI